MRTVHKFTLLDLSKGFTEIIQDRIAVGPGARVLSVASQHNNLVVYIEVEPTQKVEANERILEFLIVATGHAVPSGLWTFVGTTLHHNGDLVWHTYYRVMPPGSDVPEAFVNKCAVA
jgi:hypothetical protein